MCYYYTALYPNKRKIETKYKLPLLNWVSIPPTQITGTVFSELDDEKVLKRIDMTEFEETFKSKCQPSIQQTKSSLKSSPTVRKAEQAESLLDPNRSRNISIARKKITASVEELKQAITL